MLRVEVANMLIHEVCRITGLTKKAIDYYIEKGLISPNLLENGYRVFDRDEVERLKKIAVLRKLGLGTDEMKSVLSDSSGDTLRTLAVRRQLDIQREQAKKAILEKLCSGASYAEISDELQALENGKTIAEKLLEAFPGYYGRFVCLHFARFLNEPIRTESQQAAYDRIIAFLDDMPPLNLPEDLQDFLMEATDEITTEQITKSLEHTRKSIENPDDFLSNNREVLEKYIALRQSEEYRNSPAYRLMAYIKAFNQASGYYDVFIPAMKELSPSYAEYSKKLEMANKKLLAEYPDIAGEPSGAF
mgnify:CR=1 FL=1